MRRLYFGGGLRHYLRMLQKTGTQAAEPLIATDEPLAFTLTNPGATPGCLLICDHAHPCIPRALGNLGLGLAALEQHIAYDIGAFAVASRLAERMRAPLIASSYSRLIIDLNRQLDDTTSILEVSDGVTIPGNRNIGATQRALRAETFFHPYHRAIRELLPRVSNSNAIPCLISIHSFTPEMNGQVRPWHVGVLHSDDARLSQPVLEGLRAQNGLWVGDNEPYSAYDPEGYTIRTHAEEHAYPHVLIEIRQDLVADTEGVNRWVDLLSGILAHALERARV